MNENLELSYRRLLSSYPRSWREANEDVVLGTLLDEAEAEGWSRPRLGQRFSLVSHGMAERLGLKATGAIALVVLVISVVGTVLQVAMLEFPSTAGRNGMYLCFGLSGWLAVVSLCGLLRNLGWVGHVRSLVVSALAAPALVATTLATNSWSQGFMESDSGVPLSDFANAFIALALSGLFFGTLSAAALCDGLLSRTVGQAQIRHLTSLLLGTGLALFSGVSLLIPGTVSVLAIGIVAAVLWKVFSRKPRTFQVDMIPETGRSRVAVAAGSRAASGIPATETARILAASSAVAGLAAVAFALTGSHWFGVGLDSTGTMRLGMAFGYVAAVPFAFALAQRSGTRPGALAWPLGLIITAMLVSAAGGALSDGSGDLASLAPMVASALVASVSVGWAGGVMLRERGIDPFGPFGPAVIGVGFLLVLGSFWAFMASFAIPVLAAVFALLPKRRMVPIAATAGR